MIRDHVNAVLIRLRQDAILSGCTFQGLVTDRPNKYCAVFANSGTRAVERLTGPESQATFSFVIHSVGRQPDQAQLVTERVFAQLLDYTPIVPGRVAGRLRHVDSEPLQFDPDAPPGYFYTVDVFEYTTSPA